MDQQSGENSTGDSANQLIERVHEGMKVVDATGNDIGKVTDLKMGDPQAVTDLGEQRDEPSWGLGVFGLGPSGPASQAAAADPDEVGGPGIYPDEPHVPLPIAGQLLREGYLKIDGGLFHGDYYAAAETIQGVSSDTVQLSVAKDQLPKA